MTATLSYLKKPVRPLFASETDSQAMSEFYPHVNQLQPITINQLGNPTCEPSEFEQGGASERRLPCIRGSRGHGLLGSMTGLPSTGRTPARGEVETSEPQNPRTFSVTCQCIFEICGPPSPKAAMRHRTAGVGPVRRAHGSETLGLRRTADLF